jgi:hypothetical protein
VETVALDNQWLDIFPEENVFKGIFNRRGTSAGRTGNSDYGMFGGQGYSLTLVVFKNF